MASNPLDSAWKIAKEFHDRRTAPPSELNYFANRGFRDAIEEGAFERYSDYVAWIRDGRHLEEWDFGEVQALMYAAYLTVLGFGSLGASLLKVWVTDLRQRNQAPRNTRPWPRYQ